MAVEEAIARRVAQLISGCCWCWPWFNRGGAASCWDFSREAGLRFWCCFSITAGVVRSGEGAVTDRKR
ncbi:hypothetical protein NC653_027150 [Populus alba x Populus x berolinensis]|uniref:Uncharacterized protein n=1 Tax=Populus alba x Populus x berolinensis TaxID=444605 RepID=A0AAD6M572_9ROSI|nr:hypothetical protein NC653_027150 [Populus alba x Populus x berolinensis]